MTYNDSFRLYNALHRDSDHPDKSKSLQSWQRHCQVVRCAIMEIKAEHREHIAELSKRYVPHVVDEMSNSEWDIVQKAINERVSELHRDLEEIVASKKTQFQKISLSPPTEEQVRLLQALALRDDLTSAEVGRIGEQMCGNHQALRALRSIARKNGIQMIEPPTVEAFEDSLSRAEEFCSDMLRLIDEDNEKMGYNGKCFYDYEGVGTPKAVFDRLDSCLYAAVQLEPVEDGTDGPAEASAK